MGILGVNDTVVYVSFDEGHYLFFRISLYERGSEDDLVIVFDTIALEVEVLVELEDLVLEFGLIPVEDLRLISSSGGFFGVGSLGCVYSGVTYLKGI
jgi:hypothetical protein